MSKLNVNLVDAADIVTRSPWVDAKSFGVQAQSSIISAMIDVGSNDRTILLAPGTWDISENLVIPGSITLRVEKGAVIDIQSGITLTIDGSFDAGLYKVFAGTGDIVFRYGAIEKSHPEWWGAKSDGVTDSTTAIQSAVDACPCCCLSVGTYFISDSINFSTAWPGGSTFYGQGTNATFIIQAYRWLGIINNSTSLTFYGCNLDWDGNPEEGAVAIYSTGFGSSFSKFFVNKAYIGLEIAGASNQKAEMFSIYGHRNIGVYVHNTSEFSCNQFLVDGLEKDGSGDNTIRGVEGGLRIANSALKSSFSNGNVKNGAFSIVVDKTSGISPSYFTFTDIYFDGSIFGCYLNELKSTDFIGCKFSNGRHGSGYDGCFLEVTESVSFIDSRFFYCGGHGCFMGNDSVRTMFLGCRFDSNSVSTDSPGACHGLNISPDTSDFIITNCIATNSSIAGGRQGYGIMIEHGSDPNLHDRYVLTNNIAHGNVTGGIYDGGHAATQKTVTGNWPTVVIP